MTTHRHAHRVLVGVLIALAVAGCDVGPRARDSLGEVPGLGPVVTVDAAGEHSLALTADGRVVVWGDAEGGLGGPTPDDDCSSRSPNGSAPCRRAPTVIPFPAPVTSIAAADDHQAAVTADGRVWTWGADHDPPGSHASELCTTASGPVPCRRAPVAVDGLPPVVSVSTGLAHTVALDRDGRVWQWGEVPPPLGSATCSGEPSYGRDYPCAVRPVMVPGLPRIRTVAAHDSTNTLAVDADGGLWGWSGDRPSAAPGDTATPSRLDLPVPVVDVAVGSSGAVVVGRDGSVWVTGRLPGLAAAECGPGCSRVPVRELPPGSATATAGPGGLRVRTPDGRVLVRDREGSTPSTQPAPVGWVPDPDLAGARAVANGDQHVLVLTRDDRVLARGSNARAQLGL